jgi:hypothetical protein
MRRRVVTFDFDSTLLWWGVTRDADGDIEDMVPMGKNPDIWPRFMRALGSGAQVHIVTTRKERLREETEAILDSWGVLSGLAGVHFTDGKPKRRMLEVLGSQLHFDDDPDELSNLPPGCKGVLAPLHPSWTFGARAGDED